MRVLVVEDERKLAQILASALQAEHYDVVVAATGEDGFFRANAGVFDLVVLDLNLPGRSGLEILQTLRQGHIETPVLILTAHDGVDDRVLGLDLGADDYLRTPLSVIRGIGEIGLKETRTPAEYKEAIGSMLEEVDRLTSLVDTLLRLSHGDAGTVRLSRESVDLGQLTLDVVSSLGILAEERNQRITVDAAEGVSVSADRLVLREAITNVVDNAIKYSPKASTIAIRARADGERAALEVIDDGPGIAAEHRERIFDRFFRLDEGRSRDSGGAGLGLAIAKWAVEVNGGQISVESGATGGSVFRIVLTAGAVPLSDHHDHATQLKGEHA